MVNFEPARVLQTNSHGGQHKLAQLYTTQKYKKTWWKPFSIVLSTLCSDTAFSCCIYQKQLAEKSVSSQIDWFCVDKLRRMSRGSDNNSEEIPTVSWWFVVTLEKKCHFLCSKWIKLILKSSLKLPAIYQICFELKTLYQKVQIFGRIWNIHKLHKLFCSLRG